MELIKRLHTGISRLDKILDGGIPVGSTVLITGTSGSGKTTLAMQMLFNSAKKKEKSIFLTLTESVDILKRNMSQFSFYKEEYIEKEMIQILDMRSIYRIMGIKGDQYTTGDVNALLDTIDKLVKEFKAEILVIDSITAMCLRLPNKDYIRDFIYRIGQVCYSSNCVGLLTSEEAGSSRYYSSYGAEFICDGIIFFAEREIGNELFRTLQVIKMRGINHDRREYIVEIDRDGITLETKLR